MRSGPVHDGAAGPLDDAALAELAASVWASMLDLALIPLAAPSPAAAGAGVPEGSRGCVVTASVFITGAFEGAVSLTCEQPAAQRFAAAMLGIDVDEVAADDVSDAVGELVNVVAGNLKLLLAHPCRLSLPSVTEGADYRVAITDADAAARALLGCHDDVVELTVHTRRTHLHPPPASQPQRSLPCDS